MAQLLTSLANQSQTWPGISGGVSSVIQQVAVAVEKAVEVVFNIT